MPSRNIVKEFIPDNYYHVYNRGVEKRQIFIDDQDYIVFLGILKKYLTPGKIDPSKNRHKFDSLSNEVELIAYCLMPNHIHLMLYQISEDGITKLMRRVMTAYVMYFNERYIRVGSLFQGRYKASLINKDAYLQHISRYIHLNPKDYKTWPYSSYGNYLGLKKTEWLKPQKIMEIFNNSQNEYRVFIEEYIDTKNELEFLKWQLADTANL